jgi:tRNA dimethylallyltransferase
LASAILHVIAKQRKPKLLIIVGPTAVGKSEVALKLAAPMGAEIVNADSQQVYRYMDIGTGKPPAAERERIRHHLIDIVNPDEEFNAAIFRRLSVAAIADVESRGKRVILCGGTGLYLKALTKGLFTGPGQDLALREALNAEADQFGLRSLYQRLERVDPGVGSRIHPNDRQRIIRALEVFALTGKPISQWQKEHSFGESSFETFVIGLERDRAELYHAIDERCARMISGGLLEEVKQLMDKGYGLHLKPLQSIGYRHMGMILEQELAREEATALMKRDTRRLAKRQLTWFRADPEINWFHPEQRKELRAAAERFFSER